MKIKVTYHADGGGFSDHPCIQLTWPDGGWMAWTGDNTIEDLAAFLQVALEGEET